MDRELGGHGYVLATELAQDRRAPGDPESVEVLPGAIDDVVAMCDCFPRSILKAHKDDVFVGTPPVAFTFGLGGMLCFPMRVGASGVLVEKHTPETLLETVERFKATVCFAAPVMYRAMAAIASKFDLSSLTRCVSAGEALPDATRQAFKEATGIEIIDGIGATEMMHIFISAAGDDVRPGATGKAVPGYIATVLDRIATGVVSMDADGGVTTINGAAARLLDINRLPLDRIEAAPDGGLKIGATVRNSDLAHHPAVQRDYAVLSQAILSGASAQLRNMATTGGNLLQRPRP